MEEMTPPQPKADTDVRADRVAAFTAGTKMLTHTTRAIQAGRPLRELQEERAEVGDLPLLAVAMMGEINRRVQEELSDDRTLHAMESQFKD